MIATPAAHDRHGFYYWKCDRAAAVLDAIGRQRSLLQLDHGCLVHKDRALAGYARVRPLPARHVRRFWLHLLRNMLFKAVIVRVSAPHPDLIQRALDWGAAVVMMPQVDTADCARTCVQAVRLPSQGRRGYSRSVRAFADDLNVPDISLQPLVLVQIESAAARTLYDRNSRPTIRPRFMATIRAPKGENSL
jgi:hypothetical protein